jgi:hypothetical protein
MEKKPKGGSRSIRNAADARAYIAAGAHPDERLRRKQRCIENGWIPNDFTNPFFNHFGFNDNGKTRTNETAKYWRQNQRGPHEF